MKRLIVTSFIGLAALSLSPLASARVSLNVGIGLPGVIVGPPPVVYGQPYYAPPPVVYGGGYYGGGGRDWHRGGHDYHGHGGHRR